MNPGTTDTGETRSAPSLGRLTWAALIVGLSVIQIGSAANRPGVRAASALWWLSPLLSVGLDVMTLYVALRLARRFPLGRSQPGRHVAPHTLAAIVYSIAEISLTHWVEPALGSNPASANAMSIDFGWDLLGYATWAALAHAIEYFRRYRSGEVAALQMRTELADLGRQRAEAELRALRTELNPQIIGNSLGAVSSLVHTDPDAAERALAELGDVMRAAVSRMGTHEVTLGEEVHALEPFLAVQRERFGGRLTANWNVDETALEARMPQQVLQLLVDHALRHGVASQRPAGLRISAARAGSRGEQLQIDVTTDGIEHRPAAVPPTDTDDTDVALGQVQERLRELYGTLASVQLTPALGIGMGARLIIPWREEDTAELSLDLPVEVSKKDGRRRFALPLFLSATFLALFAIVTLGARARPLPNGAQTPLHGALGEGLIMGALATSMLYVAIRLTRADRSSNGWRAHFMAVFAFALASPVARVVLVSVMGAPYAPIAPARLVVMTITSAVMYGLLLAMVRAVVYARRYRETEAAALRLRAELAEAGRRRADAQLRALKMEINPHFLGNALGAVSSLVRTDPVAAERMLDQLDDVLRTALSRIGTQKVSLGEEIDGLAPFLAVERVRFGDRLAISWDVPDAVREARVPHMILQPLVENAVKHGLSQRGMGRIVVAGRRTGEQLEISVRDDGVGLRSSRPGEADGRGGVGLANTRARLEELYGSNARLDLVPGPHAGTIARLTLPYVSKE